MNTLQIIIALLLLFVFVSLPIALVIYGNEVEQNDNAERRRNSRYVHKGHNENGEEIWLELPNNHTE